MMKYILIAITAGIILLAALCVAAGYALFVSVLDQKLLKNKKKAAEESVPTDNPKDGMYPTASRLHFFLQPLKAEIKKIPFERCEIRSFDGLKLQGYLLRGNPQEVAILVHGYRSGKFNEFADKIEIYRKRGSTVLLVDNRAHGESEGRYIGFSELDKYDVAGWVDYINKLFDNPRIYLHGVSMGGATVIHTADMKLKNVCGIIDDCGYDSIDNLTRTIIRRTFHIPYFPIGSIAAFFSNKIAGIDFRASIGENCVAHTDIPIVFIHGAEDNFIPCSMSLELYKACRSPKELLLVEGAGHAAAYMMAGEAYTALVNRLLDGKI